MSPAQLAQIRLRLDRVAEQRRAATLQIKPTPEAVKAFSQALSSTIKQGERSAKVMKALEQAGVVTRVAKKPAGNGRNAKKQAAYRERKGEAGKATDAARKRASRAKGA